MVVEWLFANVDRWIKKYSWSIIVSKFQYYWHVVFDNFPQHFFYKSVSTRHHLCNGSIYWHNTNKVIVMSNVNMQMRPMFKQPLQLQRWERSSTFSKLAF